MTAAPSSPLPFRALRPWLLERFGRPVHRVALDAGSTCPNRDGTRGFGGCTYCDVEGSGTGALATGEGLAAQLEAGVARVARRDPGTGVTAYFQSFSNTYVPRARLEEVLGVVEPHLDPARPHPVVCVGVATRPDTLPDEALEVLAALARRVPVWVELGLEAADDEVLLRANRLHTVAEFEEAVARCHGAGLDVVGHAILGLPGDDREGACRTADVLARSGCEGVKVHHLMVLRRTQLEHQWRAGEVRVQSPDEYVAWLADVVERLRPEQVLHRYCGDAPDDHRVAPDLEKKTARIRERLIEELRARGTVHGARWTG